MDYVHRGAKGKGTCNVKAAMAAALEEYKQAPFLERQSSAFKGENYSENPLQVTEDEHGYTIAAEYIEDEYPGTSAWEDTVDGKVNRTIKDEAAHVPGSAATETLLRSSQKQSRTILITITTEEFKPKQNGCLPLYFGKHP